MTKSKQIFILISLALIGASIWVYLNQKDSRRGKHLAHSQVKARLLNYEFYRYKNDELVARTAGKKATLLDGGKLLCENKVRTIRIRNGVREELEADTADVRFLNDAALSQKNNTVDTIELSGSIDFTKGQSHLQTDWILFTEKTGEAYTDKPVRMESDGQFVAAEGGMTYNMRNESIRLRGGVFGSVRTDAVKSGLEGGHKK